ncbi:MAG: hypothetical protein D6724_09325 [Armatimonadetes bacterium]|nr:MAG: hypothetical protein D6724_09325 [Armatimonadota bacterium]
MARYFTRRQLFRLRNEIPIEDLLRRLEWPCKEREGRFCFVCPRCRESVTGVNERTNLGRCFRCEENFNPIDLVMMVREIDFVEAVHFLEEDWPATGNR